MRSSIVRIFLSLVFIAFTSTLFAQTEERPQYAPRSEKHRNVRDELGRKQGLWKYFSRERVVLYEITFLNDVKHGPFIRHNSYNGIVMEESNYFNGKRDGEYKRYNYNGTLVQEGAYAMGRKIGPWVTYYVVNGEKRTEGSYDESGKRDGTWKYYTAKGNMKAEGDYVDGLRHGKWLFYSRDGATAEEKKFDKGKELGVVSTSQKPKKKKPVGPKTTTPSTSTPGNQTNPGTPQTPNNQQPPANPTTPGDQTPNNQAGDDGDPN